MFLHIGVDTVIKTEDIIGIFDLDTSTVSRHTRKYLNTAQKDGKVITVTDDLPKSFIVCTDEDDRSKKIIYLSQISSQTLLKRAGNIGENYLKRIKK